MGYIENFPSEADVRTEIAHLRWGKKIYRYTDGLENLEFQQSLLKPNRNGFTISSIEKEIEQGPSPADLLDEAREERKRRQKEFEKQIKTTREEQEKLEQMVANNTG